MYLAQEIVPKSMDASRTTKENTGHMRRRYILLELLFHLFSLLSKLWYTLILLSSFRGPSFPFVNAKWYHNKSLSLPSLLS